MLGPYSNLLEPIHPLYNVVLDKYEEASDFFRENDQMETFTVTDS
jgi:protein farnesyltransferase subunit beta